MRYVDEGKLLRALQQGEDALRKWLDRQPRHPDLVGGKVAAAMLGVAPSYISKLRENGRMPEAIPVDGSFDGYERSQVAKLARELERERADRRARREEAAA